MSNLSNTLVAPLDRSFFADDGPRVWQEEALRRALVDAGEDFYDYIVRTFPHTKPASVRAAILSYLFGDSRHDRRVIDIAALALNDRSRNVRFNAYALLAYSGRSECISMLRLARANADTTDCIDIDAAMVALEKGNHTFFLDRRQLGRTKWEWGQSGFCVSGGESRAQGACGADLPNATPLI
jgi:hypothetical protein